MLGGQYGGLEAERDLLQKELEEERARTQELEARVRTAEGKPLLSNCRCTFLFFQLVSKLTFRL